MSGSFPLLGVFILWSLFASGVFLALSWALRRVPQGPTMWKPVLVALLCICGAVWPLELFTGWTIGPIPILLYPFTSWSAYLGLLAIWVSSRAKRISGWKLGLVVAVCTGALGPVLLLWLIFDVPASHPRIFSDGRVSPTLTYQITNSNGLRFSGGPYFDFVFYENPRRLPWLQRVKTYGEMPCTPSNPLLDPATVRKGRDEWTVVFSCDEWDERGNRKVETAEVSVR